VRTFSCRMFTVQYRLQLGSFFVISCGRLLWMAPKRCQLDWKTEITLLSPGQKYLTNKWVNKGTLTIVKNGPVTANIFKRAGLFSLGTSRLYFSRKFGLFASIFSENPVYLRKKYPVPFAKYVAKTIFSWKTCWKRASDVKIPPSPKIVDFTKSIFIKKFKGKILNSLNS